MKQNEAEMEAAVEDALEAAQRVAGEKAHVIETLDAAIAWLKGLRDYEAGNLATALKALGLQSTSKLIPGFVVGIKPQRITVCTCHDPGLSPYDCPSMSPNLRVVTWPEQMRLYVERK